MSLEALILNASLYLICKTLNQQRRLLNWEIPSTADTIFAPGKYLIRVSAYSYDKSKSYEDSSDAPFTISASQLPDLTVTKIFCL